MAVYGLLLILCTPFGTAIPLSSFYPYGSAVGDAVLPPSDDGSSSAVSLPTPYLYYGTSYTNIFVNSNGALTFIETYGALDFIDIPQSFPTQGIPMVAPFLADVDTSGTGKVWYRVTTNSTLLAKAVNDIPSNLTGPYFTPLWLFIATWDHVGYYRRHTYKTNTFQCILTTYNNKSYAVFQYADGLIQWTTGDATGGVGGLGGTPAQVGLNAGDGVNYVNVQDSRTPAIINIANTSNVLVPGQWIFSVHTAGQWVKVGYLNMSDPTQQCPYPWQMVTSPAGASCEKRASVLCDSVNITTFGASYQTVCGRFSGYQVGTPDAFWEAAKLGWNIEQWYVDGVSITYGSPGNRQHVYTYAAGIEEYTQYSSCPCAGGYMHPPSFVGSDYYCESGNPTPMYNQTIFYYADVLWDGQLCRNDEVTCCNPPTLPWFCKIFKYALTENLEVRICLDEPPSNENVALKFFELYIFATTSAISTASSSVASSSVASSSVATSYKAISTISSSVATTSAISTASSSVATTSAISTASSSVASSSVATTSAISTASSSVATSAISTTSSSVAISTASSFVEALAISVPVSIVGIAVLIFIIILISVVVLRRTQQSASRASYPITPHPSAVTALHWQGSNICNIQCGCPGGNCILKDGNLPSGG